MNQFIIENPVVCIVIAFIIGAVIMNITSAITVRMAVEKEVERALGEEDEEEETEYSFFNMLVNVYLGVDGDGTRCFFLCHPDVYAKGTGPLKDCKGDYYYDPNIMFIVDDFQLGKLLELGINVKPMGEYEPMTLEKFTLCGEKAFAFLAMLMNALKKSDEE